MMSTQETYITLALALTKYSNTLDQWRPFSDDFFQTRLFWLDIRPFRLAAQHLTKRHTLQIRWHAGCSTFQTRPFRLAFFQIILFQTWLLRLDFSLTRLFRLDLSDSPCFRFDYFNSPLDFSDSLLDTRPKGTLFKFRWHADSYK